MLVFSIFSFSNNVFKKFLPKSHENLALLEKRDTIHVHVLGFTNTRLGFRSNLLLRTLLKKKCYTSNEVLTLGLKATIFTLYHHASIFSFFKNVSKA